MSKQKLWAWAILGMVCGPISCLANLLVNPSFTDGDAVPTGWELPTGNDQFSVQRDTSSKASAPACLQIKVTKGPAEGIAWQVVKVDGGQTYNIKGKLRIDPPGVGAITIVMRRSGQDIGISEIAAVKDKRGWATVEYATRMLPGTDEAVFCISVSGATPSQLFADDLAMDLVAPQSNRKRYLIQDFRASIFRTAQGSWEGKSIRTDDGLQINNGATGNGGCAIARSCDLSGLEKCSPVMLIKTLSGNAATTLRLTLTDGNKTSASWDYDLAGANANTFVPLLPRDRTALGSIKGNTPLNLKDIRQIQLQGDMASDKQIAVVVRTIELVGPGQTLEDRVPGSPKAPDITVPAPGSAAGSAAGATAGVIAAKNTKNSGDLASVHDISIASVSTIAIELDSQRVVPGASARYFANSDDKLDAVEGSDHLSKLTRGGVVAGYVDTVANMFYAGDRVEGDAVSADDLTPPENYLIQSQDDANYNKAISPRLVSLKGKPSDLAMPSLAAAMRYVLYLDLPKPLQPGSVYEITLKGVVKKPVSFKYAPLKTRSEAIHVNQVGFRPDDPFKAGKLSLWMGKGYKFAFAAKTFNVIEDASGKSVFHGKVELLRPATDADSADRGRNSTGADVYLLDFSSLRMPGTYRLSVPEVGCSYAFQIDADAWTELFKQTMRGFYSQRSGADISPPYTDFSRQRTYHPLDGAKVRVGAVSLMQTNLGPDPSAADFGPMVAKDSGVEAIGNANGGYHDSGVSTVRRIQHLDATRLHLELCELFPNPFARMTLAMPGRNSGLIDEAMWNLDLYRKLQLASGGVCGGVIDRTVQGSYPVPPVVGRQLLALAPDVFSTYTYAASAARAAGVLRAGNAPLASAYLQSAQKAMDWAEKQVSGLSLSSEIITNSVRDRRNLAAVELLRLTRDARYQEIFKQTTQLGHAPAYRGGPAGHDQREAVFVYARMPGDLADAQLRDAAIASVASDADAALASFTTNAWSLGSMQRSPLATTGVISSQAALALLRGHYLLKNEKYVKAAISYASFLLGGNPANVSFVVGQGSQWSEHVVHPYTRGGKNGMARGLVVFGPFDPKSAGTLDKVSIKQNLISHCQPPLENWPAAECWLDLYALHEQTGYSIHESMGPASYLFGYLAVR